jgi:demethylmenaquinone methyltransferase/2-methoxy-6-polyprenyl-1,4-benzoquinol methylase
MNFSTHFKSCNLPPEIEDARKDKERNKRVIEYYANRAKEYEEIYLKPERQTDLAILKESVSNAFQNESVLEIACGTGYWTELIAKKASRITATDYNPEVIDIARKKEFGKCQTDFVISDAYALEGISNGYSASFLGFWWSHIPIEKQEEFLSVLRSHLHNRNTVMIIDNCYVHNSSTAIERTDQFGNTYQIRKLKNGEKYEVLKNFPTDENLKSILMPFTKNLTITRLKYYWIVKCTIC